MTIEDPLECVDNYRLDAIIGEGTFGQVFRGECKSTKSLVALKKVKNNPFFSYLLVIRKVRMDREKEGFPITAIREVKLLSKLNHRNVVDLKTVVQAKDLSSFFLVFEFVDNDLTGIIEHAPLKSDQIKVAVFTRSLAKTVSETLLSNSSWVGILSRERRIPPRFEMLKYLDRKRRKC